MNRLSFRPKLSHSPALWDLSSSSRTQQDSVLDAFQIQGALDLGLFLSTPPNTQPKPQIIVTSFSDGDRELSICVGKKKLATLVELKNKMNVLDGSSLNNRSSAAVELYVPSGAEVSLAKKRKRSSTILETPNTRKRRRLQRLDISPKGILVAKLDCLSWNGAVPTSSPSVALQQQRSSHVLREGQHRECQDDPLSKYPHLCTPDLLIRAKHATHLASYIQQSNSVSLCGTSNESMCFARRAAIDLMHRIKRSIDANSALFVSLGEEARAKTKSKHARTALTELDSLRMRRSEDLRALSEAYNCLKDAFNQLEEIGVED